MSQSGDREAEAGLNAICRWSFITETISLQDPVLYVLRSQSIFATFQFTKDEKKPK